MVLLWRTASISDQTPRSRGDIHVDVDIISRLHRYLWHNWRLDMLVVLSAIELLFVGNVITSTSLLIFSLVGIAINMRDVDHFQA